MGPEPRMWYRVASLIPCWEKNVLVQVACNKKWVKRRMLKVAAPHLLLVSSVPLSDGATWHREAHGSSKHRTHPSFGLGIHRNWRSCFLTVVDFGLLNNRRLLLTSINYMIIELKGSRCQEIQILLNSDLILTPEQIQVRHICPPPKQCWAKLSPHNIHIIVPISPSMSRAPMCTFRWFQCGSGMTLVKTLAATTKSKRTKEREPQFQVWNFMTSRGQKISVEICSTVVVLFITRNKLQYSISLNNEETGDLNVCPHYSWCFRHSHGTATTVI